MRVPQADDLSKVLQLPDLIKQGLSLAKIAEELGVTFRQAQYYTDAAEIIGLVQKTGKEFTLSQLGGRLIGAGATRRPLILDALKKTEIIKGLMDLGRAAQNRTLNREDAAIYIVRNTSLSISTARRRSVTVWRWLEWIGFHYPSELVFEEKKVKIKS